MWVKLFVLCFFPLAATASKILVVFPMAATSHYILGNKLMHVLAERGHEVTIVATYRDKNLPKNCKEVYLDGIREQFEDNKKNLIAMASLMSNPFLMIQFMGQWGQTNVETYLSHPAMQKLINDPNEKFDAVIIEEFVNHALKALAFHFKAPLISFSTIGPSAWTNELMENPAPASYIPDFVLTYNGTMNFWQRLVNAAVTWTRELHEKLYFYPAMDVISQKYFPGAPNIKEIAHNVSLVLINSHVSTNQPVPLLPNMIEVGGYHVDPPKKLPEDLQKYLDGSKNGVVYFSMGSNLQSKYLPIDMRDAILKAFGKLKYDVLWKFEDDNLPGKPSNVRISKWLPQQDVLAHPNVVLFITHGGLLSIIETIYHGKPIIGIPVFADQKLNMANSVANGYAVQLDLDNISEKKLTAALNEALNNPKYAENAKLRSRLMHDRIVAPKEAVGYWVEYVIRQKSGRHFRSPALDLAWYQLYSLDLIFAVLAVLLAIFFVISRIFKKKSEKPKKSKKE